MTTLKKGSKGDEVKTLSSKDVQTILEAMGKIKKSE